MTHAIIPTIDPDAASTSARSESSLSVVPALPEAAAPVTISATEMSRLTGVDRERLRTWERRHGYPVPVRCANNVRRYLADDVRRICAISRLSASGVPLAEAIRTVLSAPVADGIGSLGPALDGMRAPAIAVSGPKPLRVEWANGATRAGGDAPEVGDDLSGSERTLGPAAAEAIRALMVDDDPAPVTVELTDWMSAVPVVCEALAWRVDSAEEGAPPVVVLVQVPGRAAAVDPSSAPAPAAGDALAWARATRDARAALDGTAGLQGLQESLRALTGDVGALDGCIVLQGARSTLRSARSVRGTVASGTTPLEACPTLAAALADRQPDWLDERALLALGIDPRQRALAVPLTAAGSSIGAALLIFRAEVALSDVARELLLGFGTALAAVVERERAIARSRAPIAA